MIREYKLIETINERDPHIRLSSLSRGRTFMEAAYLSLEGKYSKMKGEYFIYNGQDSSEFRQWEVYRLQ